MMGKWAMASTLAIAAGLVLTAHAGLAEGTAEQAKSATQARPTQAPRLRLPVEEVQTRLLDVRRPQAAGTYEVMVPKGAILAAEFDRQKVRYWIIDPSTGATTTADLVVVAPRGRGRFASKTKGKVIFTLDEPAGVYLTNTQSNTVPNYQVSFTGDAKKDTTAMAGWLMRGSSNERGVFDQLRSANNGAPAAELHRSSFIPFARQMRDGVTAEIKGWEAKMTDLVLKDVVEAQKRTIEGMKFFFPTNGTDAGDLIEGNQFLAKVNAGSVPFLPWVDQIKSIATRFEQRANADAGALSSINPLALFDPRTIERKVRNCSNFTGFINETAARMEAQPENGDTDDDKGDPYINETEGGKDPVSLEQAVIDDVETRAEALSLSFESCLTAFEKLEPAEPDAPANFTDYEALAVEAEALGNDREQAVLDYVDYLDTFAEYWDGRFDEAEERPVAGQTPRYGPERWLSATEQLSKRAESFAGVGQPGVANAIEMGPQRFQRLQSSPNACDNPTWTFDFSIGGLSVVIGTPFDDRVQGNNGAASYEAIFGLWGNDCLNGRGGHEFIAGNWGDDEIHGGDGHEILTGGDGDDQVFAGHGGEVDLTVSGANLRFYLGSLVSGSAGSDQLFGSDPTDMPIVSNPLAEGYSNLFFGDGLSGANPNKAGDDVIDTQGGISFAFGQMGDDTLRAPQGGRIDIMDQATKLPLPTPILFGSIFAGQSGNDTLEGSPYLDALFGGRDNDTMSGGGFIDFMMGQLGNDTMNGNGQIDLMLGGNGDDAMGGDDGEDLLIGWAGNDRIAGGGGLIDGLFGGRGNDDLDGQAGMDLAHGGREEDVVAGGPDLNLLLGAADNDTLIGGGFIDLAFGQAGRDWLRGGAGIDLLVGNGDDDLIDGEDDIDAILGMDGNDILNGNNGIDLLFGFAGRDIAHGGESYDLVLGMTGSDCLYGDGGIDFIMGNEDSDYLNGGGDTDILLGNGANDDLFGGDGFDIVMGGDGDDNLHGDAGTDVLLGMAGADFFEGGNDTDVGYGGPGADRMKGGSGFDIAFGGSDPDAIQEFESFFAGPGPDTIHGSSSMDAFVGMGGGENDTIVANGAPYVGTFGNGGDDAIYSENGTVLMLTLGQGGADKIRLPGSGGSAVSVLLGNGGDDHIQASLGKAFIFGNRQNDTLNAFEDGDGTKDWVYGNRHDDKLWGNSSSDGSKDRLFGGWGTDTETRGAGPTIAGPPPPVLLQRNITLRGDAACAAFEQAPRPTPGAQRSPRA